MENDSTLRSKALWYPDRSIPTNLDAFRERINDKYGIDLGDYTALYQWSVDYYPQFWEEFWSYSQVITSEPYREVVNLEKRMEEIPEWFLGARMNYAENMLRHDDDQIAIYSTKEGMQEIETVTHRQLRTRVAEYQRAMKSLGITKTDRVAGFIPNCIEAIEAMLATASLGAIWSSSSPDFGVTGVLERFSQVLPKLIFTVDGVVYKEKVHNLLSKVQHVVQALPGLVKVVIIPVLAQGSQAADISAIPNAIWLDDFLQLGRSTSGGDHELTFEQVPFGHPLFIMFSSGTTGVPKCMVHSVGGTLLKHLEEHILQGDMTCKDVIMYYTKTSWMMWNWLVTSLAVGAAVVVYEGSPLVPNPSALWDLVDRIGITILGTGADWYAMVEAMGVKPARTHSLKTLRMLLSTGSPLKPASYEYVYRDVKRDVILASITGGTDIIACFAGPNPTVPVFCGEIQTRNLGMAVECFNEEGKPVYDEKGELVCTKPFPSMPTIFWNDPDGSKYHKAYFQSRFSGVWFHGDFCQISSLTGGIIMFGRSDGTLNPNGVRFGSAEIYNIVGGFKEIEDSLCVAQRWSAGEERVILFLKMVPSHKFTTELARRVQVTIREELSPKHVPTLVLETKDIPYTISGKKVEVAVRDISGNAMDHKTSVLRNPESLQEYMNIPELKVVGFK